MTLAREGAPSINRAPRFVSFIRLFGRRLSGRLLLWVTSWIKVTEWARLQGAIPSVAFTHWKCHQSEEEQLLSASWALNEEEY